MIFQKNFLNHFQYLIRRIQVLNLGLKTFIPLAMLKRIHWNNQSIKGCCIADVDQVIGRVAF